MARDHGRDGTAAPVAATLALAALLAAATAATSCGRGDAVFPEQPGSSGAMPTWCGPCAEMSFRAPASGERRYACRDCDIVIRADPKAPAPVSARPLGAWH